MPKLITRKGARTEATDAKELHLNLLAEIEDRCITSNTEQDQYLYMMAVPIIYAAWEGYFKVTMAVCLKRFFEPGKKPNLASATYPTLFLQKESFVNAFLGRLIASMTPGVAMKRVSAAKFNALSTFASEISNWLSNPVASPSGDFASLVMTYSNVNDAVATINAGVIGLDLTSVALGRLHQLLELRNNLAHGGIVQLPTAAEVAPLLTYTKTLISEFDTAVHAWIAMN